MDVFHALACDLSLSLCRNKDGDGLVHLFIDAFPNEPAGAATGKKVWEVVHEFLEKSGCPKPQSWDELATLRLADIGPQLSRIGMHVVFTTKREKGTVTTGPKKWRQF